MGGPRRCESTFRDFNNMLDFLQWRELRSQGNSLTWGGRRGIHSIRSKLDRCFGNKEWFMLFPASNQTFLDMKGSDYRPVLLKLILPAENFRGRFKFDSRFLHKPLVKDTIRKAWLTNHPSFGSSASDRLSRCRKALSRWKKEQSLNSRDKTWNKNNLLRVLGRSE